MDVTSVEINPFVVDLCKKNTAINSLDDETGVLEGSLYSPLRDD
jgi:methylase of polypeptide subunit release factors